MLTFVVHVAACALVGSAVGTVIALIRNRR